MNCEKRLPFGQVSWLTATLVLSLSAAAGCDSDIDPPLSDWLDTNDDDASVDSPDSPKDSDTHKDSSVSNTDDTDSVGSQTKDTEDTSQEPIGDDASVSNEVDSNSSASTEEPEASNSTPEVTDTAEMPSDTEETSDTQVAETTEDSDSQENDAPCLIISEYIEGSAKNKGVELLNCGSKPLSLEGFTLCTAFNDETKCSKTLHLEEVDLEGDVLAPWSVLTVCYSGIDTTFADLCDHTHALAYFNGDDRLVVKHGDKVMDAFGDSAVPPEGNPWKDVTYRRCNLSSFEGGEPFEAEQFYSAYSIDDFSDFGSPPDENVSCLVR